MKLVRHACAAATLMCLTGCNGGAHSPAVTPGWDTEQAVAALEANNCAAAWARVWPAAKAGNAEAISVLGGAVYAYGLTPPGGATDVLAQLRRTLAVYGRSASSGDSHAAEFLAALLADDFFDEGRGKEHAACLLAGTDPGGCVEAAHAAGLVPRFTGWVAETDSVADHADEPAYCSRPQRQREEALPRPQALPQPPG